MPIRFYQGSLPWFDEKRQQTGHAVRLSERRTCGSDAAGVGEIRLGAEKLAYRRY